MSQCGRLILLEIRLNASVRCPYTLSHCLEWRFPTQDSYQRKWSVRASTPSYQSIKTILKISKYLCVKLGKLETSFHLIRIGRSEWWCPYQADGVFKKGNEWPAQGTTCVSSGYAMDHTRKTSENHNRQRKRSWYGLATHTVDSSSKNAAHRHWDMLAIFWPLNKGKQVKK